MELRIHKVHLDTPGMDRLLSEAHDEGHDFVQALREDWLSGENRFDGPGEILLGALDCGILVAVGGLNRDPFLQSPEVGRIRRVYVRSAWRNRGVGRSLMQALIGEARKSFRSVRLRAENDAAARLYERIGFVEINNPDATHILHFDSEQAAKSGVPE